MNQVSRNQMTQELREGDLGYGVVVAETRSANAEGLFWADMGERFQVGAELGEGAMGQVLVADDKVLGRKVAIKILKQELRAESIWVERFVREARSVGRLEHPNIPAVHELGVGEDGRPFFAMKLVQGRTLEDIIVALTTGDKEMHQRYSFEARAQLMQGLCDAVHFAHENGICHRDIKPQNIMIGEMGEIQLLDWGASYDSLQAPNAEIEERFIGTYFYAAPERLAEPPVAWSREIDIYALGIVMYELFTLAAPFTQTTRTSLIKAVQKGAIKAPEIHSHPAQGRVPKDFANVIRTACARSPKNRQDTALRLRQDIQKALEGRAPVVCVCTAMKRSLTWVDHLVNNWSSLLLIVVLVWGTVPFLLGYYVYLLRLQLGNP